MMESKFYVSEIDTQVFLSLQRFIFFFFPVIINKGGAA